MMRSAGLFCLWIFKKVSFLITGASLSRVYDGFFVGAVGL